MCKRLHVCEEGFRLISKIANVKIGLLPVPVYLLLAVTYGILTMMGEMPNDMLGALGILMLYAFFLEEIGKRLPILKSLGGKVIVVTFFPAYMVYKNWLPTSSITIIKDFMSNNNFLTLFITLIVVGSICSMNRKSLVKATSRIIVTLIISGLSATIIGLLTAKLLGIDFHYAYFFIVVPVMAGGVGEGALPLSISYSVLMNMPQDEAFAKIIPCVFMGGLIAVFFSNALNRLGLKKTELSGNGKLVEFEENQENVNGEKNSRIHLQRAITSGCFAIALYFLALVISKLLGFPAPIVLLFIVMLMKAMGMISDELSEGGNGLYQFTVKAVTPLLLFGVGVASTSWKDLITVFTSIPTIIVLVITVLTVVVSSFIVARFTKMYPVDTAIVISCCSGQGGTGAIAILTAGERMNLMPFAQVAVRLGGAITVTIALLILKFIS